MTPRSTRIAGTLLLVLIVTACATAPASVSRQTGAEDQAVAMEKVEESVWRSWLAQAWTLLNRFLSVSVSGGFGIQDNGFGSPATARRGQGSPYQVPAP